MYKYTILSIPEFHSFIVLLGIVARIPHAAGYLLVVDVVVAAFGQRETKRRTAFAACSVRYPLVIGFDGGMHHPFC